MLRPRPEYGDRRQGPLRSMGFPQGRQQRHHTTTTARRCGAFAARFAALTLSSRIRGAEAIDDGYVVASPRSSSNAAGSGGASDGVSGTRRAEMGLEKNAPLLAEKAAAMAPQRI